MLPDPIRSFRATDHEQGEIVFVRAASGKVLGRTEDGEEQLGCRRKAGASGCCYQTPCAEFLSLVIGAFDDPIRIADQGVARPQEDSTGGERGPGNCAEQRTAGFERFHAAILAQNNRGRLTGIAVDQFAGLLAKPGQKQRDHRSLRPHPPEFLVDGRSGLRRIDTRGKATAHEPDQMGQPQAGYKSLSRNVAHGKAGCGAEVQHLVEVAGEVTHGEDFAGNLEAPTTDFAGGAEPALHLRRGKDGLTELVVLTLQRGKPVFPGR